LSTLDKGNTPQSCISNSDGSANDVSRKLDSPHPENYGAAEDHRLDAIEMQGYTGNLNLDSAASSEQEDVELVEAAKPLTVCAKGRWKRVRAILKTKDANCVILHYEKSNGKMPPSVRRPNDSLLVVYLLGQKNDNTKPKRLNTVVEVTAKDRRISCNNGLLDFKVRLSVIPRDFGCKNFTLLLKNKEPKGHVLERKILPIDKMKADRKLSNEVSRCSWFY
jgi:hypothetical protein